jgi:thiol-disulfide isomerase/thioredoxin
MNRPRPLLAQTDDARLSPTRKKPNQMKSVTKSIFTALAVAAIGGSISSHAATLTVGDPAPKLQVGKWVQGEPVEEFAPGKVYIVEFWATWCGPCRQVIPHLNDLHKQFREKGVVVIGQDVFEKEETKVEPLVREMGEKLTYRVALDDKKASKNGKMAETWLVAADQNMIPCAFIVNQQGVIAWIGHPEALNEEDIERVISGKLDLKQMAAEYAANHQRNKQITTANLKMHQALDDKRWAEAESALSELEKLLPGMPSSGWDIFRFKIVVGKGNSEDAYKMATRMSEANQGDAMLQNDLAWTLLTQTELKDPNPDLVEKIATRANQAAEGKNSAVLDTLARACFVNGKKAKAIELQEEAVRLADDTLREELGKTLASYKKGELPHVTGD